MSTAKQVNYNGQNEFEPVFKIIFGGLYSSALKEKRVSDFWTFCHSTFWSTEIFTPEQEAEFKKLIAAHFAGSGNFNKTFKELVQRAVLAKRYTMRQAGRYVARPHEWLNINYRNGLTGTAKWYNEVVEQRKTMPQYNEGLKLLAKAVLDFARQREQEDVNSYREALIGMQQYDLLLIYTNAIFHYQFINH